MTVDGVAILVSVQVAAGVNELGKRFYLGVSSGQNSLIFHRKQRHEKGVGVRSRGRGA